jgi:hypothetical protein
MKMGHILEALKNKHLLMFYVNGAASERYLGLSPDTPSLELTLGSMDFKLNVCLSPLYSNIINNKHGSRNVCLLEVGNVSTVLYPCRPVAASSIILAPSPHLINTMIAVHVGIAA